jgi:prophage maintenance system killer protein
MTESEKRSTQKVDPFLYNIIECMCEQFRPHKRKDGKEPTYSCSSCDRIKNQANYPTLQKILLYAAAVVKKIKRGRY